MILAIAIQQWYNYQVFKRGTIKNFNLVSFFILFWEQWPGSKHFALKRPPKEEPLSLTIFIISFIRWVIIWCFNMGRKICHFRVGPAHSLQPLPVIIRQANIEYQLRNIKWGKSGPVLLIMSKAISGGRPVTLRENSRSIGFTTEGFFSFFFF